MNSYMTQPPVWELYSGAYSGGFKKEINSDRLEQFKDAIETHVQTLTAEVQVLRANANWIEPQLHEFIKFNKWMEQAHPDIINAYKKSTAVATTLDKANEGDEYAYPLGIEAGAQA